jgi:hypothetical protein
MSITKEQMNSVAVATSFQLYLNKTKQQFHFKTGSPVKHAPVRINARNSDANAERVDGLEDGEREVAVHRRPTGSLLGRRKRQQRHHGRGDGGRQKAFVHHVRQQVLDSSAQGRIKALECPGHFLNFRGIKIF